MSDFDVFHPDRMASRILDMGDVMTLIEQAEKAFDQDQALKAAQKLSGQGGEFTLDDFLEQMQQIKKLGSMTKILKMLPGAGQIREQLENFDEREIDRVEAVIRSMTPAERDNPKIIDGSRRARIAKGSGRSVADVNGLVDRFFEARKMMMQMAKGGGFAGVPGMPGVPGMGGPGGGKRTKAKQAQKSKAKGGQRKSGNPAKAAQEAAAAKAKAEQQAANPFGVPAEDIDYEAAAANLDLPKDFSKFLK
jgi:signal recognition particle subunit SRP54